ncbi:trypsin-like peptidase domain-containing protein [Candidatus Azambacteria bacterium]|nr:trypsin-like peptidase domain-containing protein [Candidatus Azambacteria bacterium]
MNSQKGFIQIPILIAIIIGVLVVGGAGYVGVHQYQSNKNESIRRDGITQARRTALSNSEIVDRVKPATVFIETKKGAGSGMIIDETGYILTNAHVVWDASAAKVKLSDGKTLSAEVIGRDEIIDLAILKIVGNDFSKVSFGDSDNVIQGEDVFTLGYPFGLEGDVSFKEGTISRRISDEDATYLETSAEIHPGNSGGPLVNKYGEVVGINTASYGQSIKGVTVGETIKLAIPINVAKTLIPELKSGRKIVIDHKQYEPEPPTQNSSEAIAIKAQFVAYCEIQYENLRMENLKVFEGVSPENLQKTADTINEFYEGVCRDGGHFDTLSYRYCDGGHAYIHTPESFVKKCVEWKMGQL